VRKRSKLIRGKIKRLNGDLKPEADKLGRRKGEKPRESRLPKAS